LILEGLLYCIHHQNWLQNHTIEQFLLALVQIDLSFFWKHAMTIPHADRATVDIRKLKDYCLNPLHDEGKHKARLFAAIGITAHDAAALQEILLNSARESEATLGLLDEYGQRYIVDFVLE
jgi:hypothetical protein